MCPVSVSSLADELTDVIEGVDVRTPSRLRYQIALRVSERMHMRLRAMAIESEMSLNEFINTLFRSYFMVRDKQLKEKPIPYRDYVEPKLDDSDEDS